MEWELALTQTDATAMEASSDSEAAEDLSDDDKRVKRLAKNRESARDSRRRRKEKVQLLESRVAELTAEVNRLRISSELTAPDYSDQTMKSSTVALCYRLSTALSDPTTSDTDIDALVGEFQTIVGANGTNRIDSLTKTFRQTMDMMIPMHVKFCLWVCGEDTFCRQPSPPNWVDLVRNTSLTAQQIAKFCDYQRMFSREKVGVMETFRDLKEMVENIVQHAKSLNSIFADLQPLLEPRQLGQFALWLQKFCMDQG